MDKQLQYSVKEVCDEGRKGSPTLIWGEANLERQWEWYNRKSHLMITYIEIVAHKLE